MKRILQGELIGKPVHVNGLKGIIRNETKNLIVIEHDDGKERKWIKTNHTFTIDEKNVDGNTLVGRPEERIKRNR